MGSQIIALAEVKLRTPMIVARKVGKGFFYASMYGIPGSTILGALSREALLDNVRRKRGECAQLTSPNEHPPCDVCTESGCAYQGLWKERRIKISDALPGPHGRPRLGDAGTLPELQSIFETKRRRTLMDGLLFTTVQKMALTDKARRQLLTRSLGVGGDEAKKNPTTVIVSSDDQGDLRLKRWRQRGYVPTHVGIDSRYRAADRGLLFSINAHSEESRFFFTMVADPELLDRWVRDRELRLGAAKSRGYGLATIRLLEVKPIEAYLEMRSRDITEGFDRIQQSLSSTYSVEAQVGTLTGLSPLSLVHGGRVLSPAEALRVRIGLPSIDLLASMHRRGVRPRWDGESFIFTMSLHAGYAAAFQFPGDPQDAASRLARAEVELLDDIPGYGWIYINHPVHTYHGNNGGENAV